jgi:hypothetical protein
MNVIDEHCGRKPHALFDKELLGNASDLLYWVSIIYDQNQDGTSGSMTAIGRTEKLEIL